MFQDEECRRTLARPRNLVLEMMAALPIFRTWAARFVSHSRKALLWALVLLRLPLPCLLNCQIVKLIDMFAEKLVRLS
jgi:hypothetical protein